jgi:hypothetical protein
MTIHMNDSGLEVFDATRYVEYWYFPTKIFQSIKSICNHSDVVAKRKDVRFEVFTAVTMKNAVFWDVAPCRFCVNRRFGGTYRLHF